MSGICPRCDKRCYDAEGLQAIGSWWHNTCFKCKECNKALSLSSYSNKDNELYCKQGYGSNFGPKGFRGGTSTKTGAEVEKKDNDGEIPVYGMDKEIQAKLAAKFDPEKENAVRSWIAELIGPCDAPTLHEELKDGSRLCTLLNTIKPGAVKFKASKMAFVMRENIVKYLDACKALGMMETDCFVTQDLFEGDNLVAVIDQIYALGALSRKVDGFNGPYLGVKFADENKREFSEEVLRKQHIPQIMQGSIAVEKEKGTDHIVRYGKVGQEMGESFGGSSQINEGSIQHSREGNLDAINRNRLN
jgi:hypothetical protein